MSRRERVRLNARWLLHAWGGHAVAETLRVIGFVGLARRLHDSTIPPKPWGDTDMGWTD